MTCDDVKKNASLFLYGELEVDEEQSFQDHLESCSGCREAFAREKRIHEALGARELEPAPELLVRCRRDLAARVSAPPKRSWLAAISELRLKALAKPAAALALVMVGFFAARVTTPNPGNEATVVRVRSLETDSSGKLHLVLDETRQRVMTTTADDPRVRGLLVTAARESADPLLRAESMDFLKARESGNQIKPVLLAALEHDTNPGVRLKALDALKTAAGDRDVQEALERVLLTDDNPGVRTQAIDLLVQHKDDASIPVLQQLVQKENNSYVRLKCQRALEEMNASVGTF